MKRTEFQNKENVNTKRQPKQKIQKKDQTKA